MSNTSSLQLNNNYTDIISNCFSLNTIGIMKYFVIYFDLYYYL